MRRIHKITIATTAILATTGAFLLQPSRPTIAEVVPPAMTKAVEMEIMEALMHDPDIPARYKIHQMPIRKPAKN